MFFFFLFTSVGGAGHLLVLLNIEANHVIVLNGHCPRTVVAIHKGCSRRRKTRSARTEYRGVRRHIVDGEGRRQRWVLLADS